MKIRILHDRLNDEYLIQEKFLFFWVTRHETFNHQDAVWYAQQLLESNKQPRYTQMETWTL